MTQIDNKFVEVLKHENVQDIVEQVQESEQLDFIVQPIKDEIFSSWLFRLLHENCASIPLFMKSFELRQTIKPSSGDTRVLDLDQISEPRLFKKLSDLTGFDLSLIENLKLSDWHNKGKWGEINKLPPLKFCLSCLKKDKIPYIRKDWRISIYTICIIHQEFLIDTCHNCKNKIDYFNLDWDQPITQCLHCKIDLLSGFSQLTDQSTFDKFTIIWNIYVFNRIGQKEIDRTFFFRQMWKSIWIENNRDTFQTIPSNGEFTHYSANYERFTKDLILAYDRFLSDPKQIDYPFTCIEHKKYYKISIFYLNHLLTHFQLKCPLIECGNANQTFTWKENCIKCVNCGTLFDFEETIHQKGIAPPQICPGPDCFGKSLFYMDEGFRCQSCKSYFSHDLQQLRSRQKPRKCLSTSCNSKTISNYKDYFKCYRCGSIMSDTEILFERIIQLKSCPNETCDSKSIIHVNGDNYSCRFCNTQFDSRGKIGKKGLNRPDNCIVQNCNSTSFTLGQVSRTFRCRGCQSIYNELGEIVEYNAPPPIKCPLKNCTYSSFNPVGGNYRCRKCSSLFTSSGEIIEPGSLKKWKCPHCASASVKIYYQNLRCKPCGTVFDDKGEIIDFGITPPEICPQPSCVRSSFEYTKGLLKCKYCRSKFDDKYQIIVNGVLPPDICPNCDQKSYYMPTRGNKFRCRKCNEIVKNPQSKRTSS